MSITRELGDERIVDLPQGSVRIYERGQGEPIVFAGGLFANAAAWRNVVPLLAGGYRCITADWPFGAHRIPMKAGADQTPTGIAGTIADTIEALGLDRVTLVGNDGGGVLSQLVVAHRPERIGRLVLTSCDAYDNFPPRMFDPLVWAAKTPGAVALLAHSMRLNAVRRAPFGFGWLSHTRVPDVLLDHYLAGLGDPGVRRDITEFLKAVDDSYTLEAAERFGAFDRPVLIAWGEDDRFFPCEHAERLAGQFPDSRLEWIPGSRTWVAEDQPERVATLIDTFITETTTIKETADAAA